MCINACGNSGKTEAASKLVDTGAAVPDPCSLISKQLANELIGVSSGTRAKKGDYSGNSHPACDWKAERSSGAVLEQESIGVQVSVSSKRPKSGDRFLASKAAYTTYTSNKNCKEIKLDVAESCWYHDANFTLAVVIRRDYVVVWVNVVGDDSPSLKAGKLAATAQRIAVDTNKVLSRTHGG
jgi:hypothetical protein